MKKLLLTILALSLSLHAFQGKFGPDLWNDINIQKKKQNIDGKFINVNVKKYINNKNCNEILPNNGYFTTCYDNNLKSPIFSFVVIDKRSNPKGIEERPRFYNDRNLPKKYQTTYSDFTHSGYDRGHSGYSDAASDYSQKSLNSSYVMSNIVPQKPITNRHSYRYIETFVRQMGKELGSVNVLTINLFSTHPKRIGRSGLAVPKGFGKVIWNDKHKFQQCFYLENDNSYKLITESEISCTKLLNGRL